MCSIALRQERLLSPKETSEYLGIPTSTLAVWRSTGRVLLPYVKVGGHVRYRPDDIERFLNQQGQPDGAQALSGALAHPTKAAPAKRSPLRAVRPGLLPAYNLDRFSMLVCESCSRKLERFETTIATDRTQPNPSGWVAHCLCPVCHRSQANIPRATHIPSDPSSHRVEGVTALRNTPSRARTAAR